MNKVIFNIRPELLKINNELKDIAWANYRKEDILDEISDWLSSNISKIIRSYYVTARDLEAVHNYLDELRDDITGKNVQGMEIGEAVNKFENSLLHNILFSRNTRDIENLQQEFPRVVLLIKQQMNNTYISEKRKRRINTLSLIVSIISALIATLSFILYLRS